MVRNAMISKTSIVLDEELSAGDCIEVTGRDKNDNVVQFSLVKLTRDSWADTMRLPPPDDRSRYYYMQGGTECWWPVQVSPTIVEKALFFNGTEEIFVTNITWMR